MSSIKAVTQVIFLSLFMLLGCKGSEKKQAKQNPEPSWVASQPQSAQYYIGVFGVNKTTIDYRNKAKKGALENLASEISVQISGESVLKTVETNSDFQQEYQQDITVKSTENLEGFELVDAWESDTQYWVYYRLSKQKHEELKLARKNKALDLGKSFFLKAQNNHQNNNYKEAFILNIKALEAVSEFLDQPLETVIDTKEVFFATHVMSYTQNMLDELELTSPSGQLSFVLGQVVNPNEVYFLVKNKNGIAISDIPIKANYKAVFFKNYDLVSNVVGRAEVNIGKINQSEKHQTVKAEMNFSELLEQSTKNKIIRRLFSYIPNPNAQINITVRAPKIYVIYLNGKRNNSMVNVAKQALSSRGFTVVNSQRDADLVFKINTIVKIDKPTTAGTVQANITGNVEVLDIKTNATVFNELIPAMKGLQLTGVKASADATEKAEDYLKRRLVPKLGNEYFAF